MISDLTGKKSIRPNATCSNPERREALAQLPFALFMTFHLDSLQNELNGASFQPYNQLNSRAFLFYTCELYEGWL